MRSSTFVALGAVVLFVGFCFFSFNAVENSLNKSFRVKVEEQQAEIDKLQEEKSQEAQQRVKFIQSLEKAFPKQQKAIQSLVNDAWAVEETTQEDKTTTDH